MEVNNANGIVNTYQSSSSQSFESGNSMSALKYYGLKKSNFIKKFRKDIIQLTNYVFSISPPLTVIHNIMSALRIMQFLLPCFIPAYFNYWKINSVDQVTINVLAVLIYLLPPTSLFTTAHILLIIYDIIQLIVIIIFISSSFYFKKYAKLPIPIAIFLYIYHSTFGHYLHPIILYTIFEGISYITSPGAVVQISSSSFAFLLLISIICILFNFFFMSIFLSQTLVFRPNSLSSVTSIPQFFLFYMTILINIFFGIGTNLKKTYQIIFLSINVILYSLTSFATFTRGGFTQTIISNFVLSSSITGAVFTIVDIIFIILNKNGSVAVIFCFIVFLIIMLLIVFFILQYSTVKQLKLLDSIYEDHSLFSLVTTPNYFLQLCTRGIKFAHPIITELTFFILAVEKWSNNQFIYFIYAKFIAIYPEETQTLKYIYKSVKMLNFSDSTTRCVKEQTKTILKQREFGLSSELRSKINRLRKQVQSTKHKLGYVWDVIIRGNLNDIEIASKRAISNINETNTDFKHLLHEYPNNRNVTYIYSGFLNDVMADHLTSEQMHERTKLLLPGLTVIEDQTHDYGLKMFPNLRNTLRLQQPDQPMMSSTAVDPNVAPSCLNMERDMQKDLDQISGIMMNIENLTIPSILFTKIAVILSFLIFFFIPCVFGLIYIEFFIDKLQQPLKFISSLSLLRSYAYQVIGFSLRYVGENMTIFNKIGNITRNPPSSFGGTWNTRNQLEYILTKTTDALQEFGSFRMFEEDNHYIQQAQMLIFQNTVPYNYYTSPTNVTTSMISISAAILDYTIQQKMILTGYGATQSILSSGTILNPINNAYSITVNIHEALGLMIEYIAENHRNTKKFCKIALIVVIVAEIVFYSILLTIEIKWINSNKTETYQCLFSLPKNIVSELAENRDSKKRDNQNEDMNKQDENILKIFNSGGNSEKMLLSDVSLLIIGTGFIVITSIICVIIYNTLYVNLTRIVRNSAPHLHYLLASYSMLLSSINWLNVILFEFGGHPIPTVDFNFSIGRMEYVMERSRHYYHLITAGGPSNSEVPFRGFMNGVRNASPINCSFNDLYNSTASIFDLLNSNSSDNFVGSNFNSLTKVLACSPVDMTFTLIEPIISYSLLPYQKGVMKNVDPKSPSYEMIWIQLISPLYDLFFEPLHNQIIPSITNSLGIQKNKYVPIIVSLIIESFLFEIVLIVQIKMIENHIKSVLRFLLHCNPSTIFSSSKIMRILSGDFSSQQNDSLDRNNSFFDTVFTSLPDAIMYANMPDMIIQNANKACKQIFGDVGLVGQSIRDFFASTKFSGNIENLFSSVKSNPTEEIAFKREGGSELIFKATSMIACGKFVISCKNVTQSHNYNNLILEEKLNSDKLLKTILPPSLVTRVQEGEKNISFSVQSASILFSDIVNFTPWCGSLPPEKVMCTLNILFKRFDSILDTKRTMTKIKCIGDCYMAAGGIFSEVNQPAVHAEEVVSFGLQSIKEILLIDQEIHQNLKIRVGVNTGGPVVAGVLGIGKPTFEILGPAINRAQQMEQNGFPLKVHISIDVYELICGLNFKFCNRRTIDCKNEKVETYLVEP